MIYVLVDIDETMLSVPSGINGKSSRVMFEKVFGIKADEDMIDNVGKTELGIVNEVLAKFEKDGHEIPKEAYKIWADALEALLIDNPPKVLPGIKDFLDTLSKNPEVSLVLLTGNSVERAEVKLRTAGLDKYFRDGKTGNLKGVFGTETAIRGELFPLLVNKLGKDGRYVVVDDSLIGAKMAKEYGLLCISVLTGKATKEDLMKLTSHVFENLGEGRYKKAVELIVSPLVTSP